MWLFWTLCATIILRNKIAYIYFSVLLNDDNVGPRTQAKNDLLWISYWFEWPSATWPCAEGCNSSDHVLCAGIDFSWWDQLNEATATLSSLQETQRDSCVCVLFYTRSWHSLCLHVSQAECQHLNARRLVVIDLGILSTPERNLRLRYLLPVSQRLLSFSMQDLCLIRPLRSATRLLSPFVFVFFCHWTLCRVTEFVSYLEADSLTLLPNTERFGAKILQLFAVFPPQN